MNKTRIEWASHSWNPTTGCTPISAGCAHCYAERSTRRFWKAWGCEAPPNHFGVKLHPERLIEPTRWKKPRLIFVCSMSDLFHDEVPSEFIRRLFTVIGLCAHHTFLILTKRPDRMVLEIEKLMHEGTFFSNLWWGEGEAIDYFPNTWYGVSVENQQRADERIPVLLEIPGHHFISYEPALGPLDLAQSANDWWESNGIEWVIGGGESGPKRRPAQIDWFRKVRDDCRAVGVPYFMKQMEVDGKIVHMPELDGQVWAEMPQEMRELQL